MKKSGYFFIFVFVFSLMIFIMPLSNNVYADEMTFNTFTLQGATVNLMKDGTGTSNHIGIVTGDNAISIGNNFPFRLNVSGYISHSQRYSMYYVNLGVCSNVDVRAYLQTQADTNKQLESGTFVQQTSISCNLGSGSLANYNDSAKLFVVSYPIRNTDNIYTEFSFATNVRIYAYKRVNGSVIEEYPDNNSYIRLTSLSVGTVPLYLADNSDLINALMSGSVAQGDKIDLMNTLQEQIINNTEQTNTLISQQTEAINEQNRIAQQSLDFQQDTNINESTGEAGGFFDSFVADKTGLSGIVAMPLMIIDNLISYKGNMAQLVLPLPFINTSLTIPNMYTVFNNAFPEFVTLYQIVTDGVISYMVLKGLFTKVMALQSPSDDKVDMLDL